MKLAVLSDIHGNLAALEEVADHVQRWQADVVVVAGDIVNRGPRSPECLQFVLERERHDGWQVIRGNHEEYIINVARAPKPREGLEECVRENVVWVYQQLSTIEPLEAMPQIVSFTDPSGGEVRIAHASMRHNRDNILENTPDDLLREQIAPAPRLFCCGHTHRPVIRRIDATLVVNVGSVGLPFDGNVRASYGQLTLSPDGWQARIARVDYNREQTKRDYEASGFLRDSGPVAPLIYNEFLTAYPRLFTFIQRFQSRVLGGELTPEQAVHDFLAEIRT